ACGEDLPVEITMALPAFQATNAKVESPPDLAGSRQAVVQKRGGGSTFLCVVLGLAFLGVGAYFLLNPNESTTELFGRSIVNMHRLAFGETSSIVGAIFLAAGIRPR